MELPSSLAGFLVFVYERDYFAQLALEGFTETIESGSCEEAGFIFPEASGNAWRAAQHIF